MSIATISPRADIGALAQEIQQQAATARHLARTVSQALSDFDDCSDCRPHKKDGAERILLFSDLIEEVAKKIGAIALQVEEADSRLHQPAAA